MDATMSHRMFITFDPMPMGRINKLILGVVINPIPHIILTTGVVGRSNSAVESDSQDEGLGCADMIRMEAAH
jgi:hypothetical protein